MKTSEQHAAQLRRGLVELAVLGLLADGPKYGQQIVEDLAARPALAVTAGTVYPLLSRLLKSGLIASEWQESPVGPPRKYYRLTPDGVGALQAMSAEWRRLSTTINSILKEH